MCRINERGRQQTAIGTMLQIVELFPLILIPIAAAEIIIITTVVEEIIIITTVVEGIIIEDQQGYPRQTAPSAQAT
jgi:hypothetical protein